MGIIIPTLPLFALSLGASETLAGVVVSMAPIGRLLFSVPAGNAVNVLGEKRAIQVQLMAS